MKIHPLASPLCAALAALLPACRSVIHTPPTGGAPTTMAERDSALAISGDTARNLGYRNDWRGFPAIATNERIARMEVYPDAIIVQESGSAVTVLEPSNGSIRWSSSHPSRLTKFVGMARVVDPKHGDVFTVASEAEVYVLATATGTLLAREPFEKVVNTAPVTIGAMGVYGTATGELLCHQYANGVKMWGVDANGSYEQAPVLVGPGVAGAVTTTGRVSFVNLMTGNLIGGAQTFGGPGAELASNDSALYVASVDQSLYAFIPTGSQLWRHRTAAPLRWKPTANADAVYCAVEAGLTAFDAGTGTVRWTAKGVDGTVLGKRRTNLLVWNGRTMFLVDEQRGDVMGSEAIEGVEFIRMSRFDDGDMYIVSTSGVVAKLVAR